MMFIFNVGVLENAQPYGIVPKENLVFVITNEVTNEIKKIKKSKNK